MKEKKKNWIEEIPVVFTLNGKTVTQDEVIEQLQKKFSKQNKPLREDKSA